MNNRLFWYLTLLLGLSIKICAQDSSPILVSANTSQAKSPLCPFLLKPYFSSLAESYFEPSLQSSDLGGNCWSEKHWQELAAQEGEDFIQNSMQEFFKEYYGPWAELQENHSEGFLWQSMIELSSFDPLVKALMANDVQRVSELCKSETVQLNNPVDLPFTNIKANYLTIAFFVADQEKEAPQGAHVLLKALLDCGAHPDAALYFNNERLPLILLALILNDKITIRLLVDHGADLNVSFGGHSLSQISAAFEKKFKCKGYTGFLERYSGPKLRVEAAAPGLALPDAPQAAYLTNSDNFIAELIEQDIQREKEHDTKPEA